MDTRLRYIVINQIKQKGKAKAAELRCVSARGNYDTGFDNMKKHQLLCTKIQIKCK